MLGMDSCFLLLSCGQWEQYHNFLISPSSRKKRPMAEKETISSWPFNGPCFINLPKSSPFFHISYYMFFKHCAPDPQPNMYCLSLLQAPTAYLRVKWRSRHRHLANKMVQTRKECCWSTLTTKFNPHDQYDGKRELTFTSCPLTSTDNKRH